MRSTCRSRTLSISRPQSSSHPTSTRKPMPPQTTARSAQPSATRSATEPGHPASRCSPGQNRSIAVAQFERGIGQCIRRPRRSGSGRCHDDHLVAGARPPSMNPAIMMSSPVPTKARVLIFASFEPPSDQGRTLPPRRLPYGVVRASDHSRVGSRVSSVMREWLTPDHWRAEYRWLESLLPGCSLQSLFWIVGKAQGDRAVPLPGQPADW